MFLQQGVFAKLLGNRKATVICLLLALLNKILIAWLYSDLEGDKALYLLITKGFLDTGLFKFLKVGSLFIFMMQLYKRHFIHY